MHMEKLIYGRKNVTNDCTGTATMLLCGVEHTARTYTDNHKDSKRVYTIVL